MMKRAPVSILRRNLRYWGTTSRSWRLWFVTTAPRKKFVGFIGRPVAPSRRPRFISEYIERSPTESMSKLGRAMPPYPGFG